MAAAPINKRTRQGAAPQPEASGEEARPRASGESQRRILEAARTEFADEGFAGARTDRIVKRAGVNQNLLYHYFGSKERLFVAVMEQVYAEVRERHRDMELERLKPEAAIRRFTEATFDLFVQSDDVIRLLSTENIHRAEHIRGSERIGHIYNPLLTRLDAALRRGREEGCFRSGVDAQELFITITGLSYFYLSNRHTLSVILHDDLEAPARLARRRRHIAEVVTTFLRHGNSAHARASRRKA